MLGPGTGIAAACVRWALTLRDVRRTLQSFHAGLAVLCGVSSGALLLLAVRRRACEWLAWDITPAAGRVDTGGGEHTTHCSNRQNFLTMQHAPAAMTTTSGVTAGNESAVAMEMTMREPATSTDSGAGRASEVVMIVVSDSGSERGELAFSSESTMAAKAACHDLDEMD